MTEQERQAFSDGFAAGATQALEAVGKRERVFQHLPPDVSRPAVEGAAKFTNYVNILDPAESPDGMVARWLTHGMALYKALVANPTLYDGDLPGNVWAALRTAAEYTESGCTVCLPSDVSFVGWLRANADGSGPTFVSPQPEDWHGPSELPRLSREAVAQVLQANIEKCNGWVAELNNVRQTLHEALGRCPHLTTLTQDETTTWLKVDRAHSQLVRVLKEMGAGNDFATPDESTLTLEPTTEGADG